MSFEVVRVDQGSLRFGMENMPLKRPFSQTEMPVINGL